MQLRQALTSERDRNRVLVLAVQCGVDLVEQHRQRLGEMALHLARVTLGATDGAAWEAAAENAREVLAILREDRVAYSLLERATEGRVVAEMRVAEAVAALAALEAVVGKGSRSEVAAAVFALGQILRGGR